MLYILTLFYTFKSLYVHWFSVCTNHLEIIYVHCFFVYSQLYVHELCGNICMHGSFILVYLCHKDCAVQGLAFYCSCNMLIQRYDCTDCIYYDDDDDDNPIQKGSHLLKWQKCLFLCKI